MQVMVLNGTFYTIYEKMGITWSYSTKIKNTSKLQALDIFRLIRPFSRVQIDAELVF